MTDESAPINNNALTSGILSVLHDGTLAPRYPITATADNESLSRAVISTDGVDRDMRWISVAISRDDRHNAKPVGLGMGRASRGT